MVIDLELAHFIAKFYMVGYFICFLMAYLFKENNLSNLIITSFVLIKAISGQYLKENLGFNTFYLGAAFECMCVILFSIVFHHFFKVKQVKTTLYVYLYYFLIAISYMILHRVRVVLYSSDESIMWLINSQSGFTLTLYFLIICTIFYGCKIKWKLQFGRLS